MQDDTATESELVLASTMFSTFIVHLLIDQMLAGIASPRGTAALLADMERCAIKRNGTDRADAVLISSIRSALFGSNDRKVSMWQQQVRLARPRRKRRRLL